MVDKTLEAPLECFSKELWKECNKEMQEWVKDSEDFQWQLKVEACTYKFQK